MNMIWMINCVKVVCVFIFQVVNEAADVPCPVAEMSTRAKLSCLSWNKYTRNQIASSDYEGIVTVWDVTTRQVLSSFNSFLPSCPAHNEN